MVVERFFFQDFLPIEALFNDFLCKFQDRMVCAKWDLFFPFS